MRKYNREEEKKIEKEWDKYDEHKLPIIYENGIVRDDLKEAARDIFGFLWGDGNRSNEYLRKVFGAVYDAHIFTEYYDFDEDKYFPGCIWYRSFTIVWEGFKIEVIFKSGKAWRNFFQGLFGRSIHISNYCANISYKEIPINGHYEKLQILLKLREALGNKIIETEKEYKEKIASIVSNPGEANGGSN